MYGTDISSRALSAGERGMYSSLGLAYLVRASLERDDVFVVPGREGSLPADLHGHRGLALPRETLAKVYSKNFQRLYGAAPAPLDRAAALAELLRLADEVDALAGGKAEDNTARQVASLLQERKRGV